MGRNVNGQIPNAHFHKVSWQNHVKTWFEQAARKKRRRTARQEKAAKMAPRPAAGMLRPVVRPPTVKYNYKLRQGRGFTFAELKEAGINKKQARGIGISVDHRRRNRCNESLQLNAQRLKQYHSKLIVFPRRKGKVKAGDADAAALANAQQLQGPIAPVPKPYTKEKARKISDVEDVDAFHKIRMARADYRLFGIRQRNRLVKEAAEK